MKRIVFCLILLGSSVAHAGFLLKASYVPVASATPQASQLVVSGGSAALQTSTEGVEHIMLFTQGNDYIDIVNAAEKTYVRLQKHEVAQYNQRLDTLAAEVKKKAQAQLALLDEAQRKQVEALLEKSAKVQLQEPTRYEKLASGKVGSWACTNYAGYVGTVKVLDLCVAKRAVLGISDADYAVLDGMQRLFSDVMHGSGIQLAPYALWRQAQVAQMQGVPIKVVVYHEGESHGEFEVQSIEARTVDKEHFTPPAGFVRKTFESL